MRNVGERATVHQARCAFERLHKVGLDCVAHERSHRAFGLQVARIDRLASVVVGDQNVAETLLEVLQVGGKAQDRHNFRSHCDHKVIFTRYTVDLATQTDRNVAKRAIVHVHHAGEGDAARVDAQCVTLLQVVVQHGAQQVVGCGDRVHVAGEVQVDVLHRHNLRVAAAGRAALDTKHRAERWLAQGDHCLFTQLCHRLTETDRCGRLAFACGCGIDGGDEYQLTVRIAGGFVPYVGGQLGLVFTVEFEVVRVQSGGCGNVDNRAHLAALCDFNIG